MEEVGKCTKTAFHKHAVSDLELFEECTHADDYDPTLNGLKIQIDGDI